MNGARGVRVRPLTGADWLQVRDVYAEGIATGHATFESEPPTWAAFDAGRLPEHRYVAVLGDAVLGWVAASPVSDRCAYSGVAEHSVYVAAAARGRGIGRLLLAALIDSTEASGIWTLQAGVFPENLASLALHETLGFTPVGLRRRIGRMTYGPLADQWRDVVLIERRSDRVG